jgi:glycerol-3-phosphate dehydrogenase (NAD(P)+)
VARQLKVVRENKQSLPGVKIPQEIVISSSFEQIVSGKDLIVIAVPSHVARSVGKKVNRFEGLDNIILVSVTKGIENRTLLRISQVLLETINWLDEAKLAVLSGPSHAEEVSRKIPTAVVVASRNHKTAELVQKVFMSPEFRVYTSDDVIGVELGGSLKNIIAIAAGICDGAGFGDNTKAALQPRGLAEIVRLGVKMGANPLTFAGLSGMGDLIVTCMSQYSRNRYVGEQIGKGRKLEEVLNEMVMVAEGVRTTRSAHQLSKKYGVEMPITGEVYKILFQGKDPKAAVYDLMSRDAKPESWG